MLLCGIETLDLGLFINWGPKWPDLFALFQKFKDKAQNSDGLLEQSIIGRKFLFHPGGRGSSYRFHLQFPEYQLYLAKQATALTSPNGYASFNAKSMWLLGLPECLQLINSDLAAMSGRVEKLLPSRIDLTADFLLPAPLTLDFLKAHKVCRSRFVIPYCNGEDLETFYVGKPSAPLRLRIYDKGKEAKKKGKDYFLDLWDRESFDNVWRIEFQVRRQVLKEFGIDSAQNLSEKVYGLWYYLTQDWFSLRLPENDRSDRRPVHPFWETVERCGNHLGPAMLTQRCMSTRGASLEWYVSHVGGCLPSVAARMGTTNINDTLNEFGNRLCLYWFNKNFSEEYQKRSIRLAQTPTEEDEP